MSAPDDNQDPFTAIQERIRSLLQSDAVFTPTDPAKKIEVLTQKVGDLQNQITEKIKKLGISVTVFQPGATLLDRTVPTIDLGTPFVVEVSELALINKTGVSALAAVIAVLEICQGKWTGIGNPDFNIIYLDDPPFVLKQPTPIYHVNLLAAVQLTPRQPKPAVATP